MDETFPHTYSAKLADERSRDTRPHYYYPGASTLGGRDGLLVEIQSNRAGLWMGTFAFGHAAPKSVSNLVASPAPERLCVISRGEGYMVDADQPTAWETIPIRPIVDVRTVYAKKIIVFANFTELIAFGATGLKWRTQRLAWDGLTITDVSDSVIRGECRDIRSEATTEFEVNLENGVHKGGIKDV